MTKCIECGHEFEEGLGACPECGCPISAETDISKINEKSGPVGKKDKKVNKLIAGIICAVLLLTVCAATIVIYIKSTQVKTVAIKGDLNELKVGEGIDLTYEITPKKAKIKDVYWSSSDAEVASVQDGHVTAHKSGECIISVDINSKIKAEYFVTVIDLVEQQKNAISKLVSFIEEYSDYASDGISMVTVGEIDSETDFFIGCKSKDVYLVIEKEPRKNTKDLSCYYNTYVVIKNGDIEQASFRQYNAIDVLGYKANSTSDGVIDINEYKLGDKVKIDSFKSTMDDAEGIETGVTDDLQKLADNGVKNGFEQLKKYLEENDDIGCSIDDLQLNSIYE